MPDRRLSDIDRGPPATVVFDGRELPAFEGESLAMALWANGVRGIRGSSRVGEARGVFCNMGICYECLVDVVVDGVAVEGSQRAVRACMEPVVGPRMVVTSRRPPS